MGMMINRRRGYGGKKDLLPSGYKQLEYIESTGKQYIDTNFVPNPDTRVVAKLSVSRFETSSNTVPFGSRYTNLNRHYGIVFGGDPKDGYYKTLWSGYGNSLLRNDSIYLQTNVIYYFDKNKNIFYLDNTVAITNDYNSFTSVYNFYLFAMNQNNIPTFYSYIKLYSSKIYDNNTLVRDFIPCRRKSDNVVGMYDLVNNTFYTNAGTGDFIAGPDV